MSDPAALMFRDRLRCWVASCARTLPWRNATPFGILIAEVMLRRTRAEQVAPVFHRFLARYPDAVALAAAPDEEITEVVRPLGLEWRVPAFKQLAQALIARHGGQVPVEMEQLLALPGVGDYIANAVRVFAFDRPSALIDTNTVRVAARYFGFPYHADSRRNRGVRARVEPLLDQQRPRESARTLLDFAALVCNARQPKCSTCPVADSCVYARFKNVDPEDS